MRSFFNLRRVYRIWYWKRHWRIRKHLKAFNNLYNEVNGFFISQAARAALSDAPEYLYGEIDFTSFAALLSQCRPTAESVFYDLGSGTGKAVLTCAMVFGVQKSCGIELLSELHNAAIKQRQGLQAISGYEQTASHIHFLNQNFFEADLSDATIIFVNATAFFGPLWEDLCQHLEKTAPQALIVTTSKTLKSNYFSLIHSTVALMSWGSVKTFIHKPPTC